MESAHAVVRSGWLQPVLRVTGAGLLFSLWLTYLELFVIHALCRWCLGSAAMTVVLFGLAVWDSRVERGA